MAMHLPKGGSVYNAEPNVVPMIDILLVLLIIFMMQVPLSRMAMDVQVPPEQQQQQQPQQAQNQIVLELLEDGSYAVNGQAVLKTALGDKFHEIYDNRPAKLLFVKTHGTRKYQDVIEAMDVARGAGVQVIGFTPPEAKK